MFGIPDTIFVAIVMIVPTLLVYFGSRKKQRAETDDLISAQWEKLTKAQSDFAGSMEIRLQTLNGKIGDQDRIIAQQNETIARQNQTIAEQAARIAEQDKVILEQNQIIADLTKQIEGLDVTPVHRRKNVKNS